MVSFGCTPRSGITGSYGRNIFSFFSNLHTLLYSRCASLYYHQQCQRGPFFPHPLQHVLFVDFLKIVFLTGVRCYLIIILICISLIISNIDHLFMCLLVICISSSEKCLFRSSVHFLIFFFFYFTILCWFCRTSTWIFVIVVAVVWFWYWDVWLLINFEDCGSSLKSTNRWMDKEDVVYIIQWTGA